MSNNDSQGFYASRGICWSDPCNQTTLLERLTTPTFVPRPWQIEATGTLLDGHDLLLIAATGQGKSSIIYLPIRARPDKITLVITPTNLLEHDHVCAMTLIGHPSCTLIQPCNKGAKSDPERAESDCNQCRHRSHRILLPTSTQPVERGSRWEISGSLHIP